MPTPRTVGMSMGPLLSGRELDTTRPSLALLIDSQDITGLIDDIGTGALTAHDIDPKGVTAALVATGESEYTEVWVTETSRPGSLSAIYCRVI